MITRTYQTSEKDCLNACVSSLTGIPIEELNEKCPKRGDLGRVMGLLLVEVRAEKGKLNIGLTRDESSKKPFELILGCQNEDGSLHAVVGEMLLGEDHKISLYVTHDPDLSVPEGKVYTITSLIFLSRRL